MKALYHATKHNQTEYASEQIKHFQFRLHLHFELNFIVIEFPRDHSLL